MSKTKKDKPVKIVLGLFLVNFVKKQCKRHKMRIGEYILYVAKIQTRKTVDLNEPDNHVFLFTTKEARAYRRDYIYKSIKPDFKNLIG